MIEEWKGPDIIELANNVIWPIKKLHRPLGELLASGEVNKQDLNWAAEKYFDPKIKWAAAVELQAQNLQQVMLLPTVARRVVWPFKGLNQPIGNLLDKQIINLHDLAYAVANAYTQELRSAAAVLGAEIVCRQLTPLERKGLAKNQIRQVSLTPSAVPIHTAAIPSIGVAPAPVASDSKQTLQIVNGSKYLTQQLRRRQHWAAILMVVVLDLWLLSLFIGVVVVIVQLLHLAQVSLGWLVASGALLVGALLILPRAEQLIDEIENYKKGRKGEQLVAKALRNNLNQRWTLFRNIILPGRQDDIDAILIGPNGIYALEIKTFSGTHRNIGDSWQRKYGPLWHKLSRNPGRQAQRNAQRLHDYLQQCDVTVWIEPRVVWASRSKLLLSKPTVPVWQLTRGKFIGEDLTRGKALDETARHQIVALLKANNLAQKQNGSKQKQR
ncbi:MAG: nuclease-related domain-containing protein [Chloroflexota bacterium]|nr:nuclease-related domain-containing protein [Chloroflexota bacterium]